MTALKWTITTQERNALVETHLGCIWWTINKNRRLISAAAWETAREQRTRADKADAAIAAAISTLSNLLEARKNGVEVGWRDVDRVVADALDILKGGKAE